MSDFVGKKKTTSKKSAGPKKANKKLVIRCLLHRLEQTPSPINTPPSIERRVKTKRQLVTGKDIFNRPIET